MKVYARGKNIEVTPALQEYLEKKLKKLDKYFNNELEAHVTLSVVREIHSVDVTISIDSLLLRGEEATDDMCASIDLVVDKLERQLHKYKTRINRKLRQKGTKEQLTASAKANEADEPRVVRTKRFVMKPMSLEEAILQMELLGHDFYVFANEAGEINVLYRRKDGNYGLIAPGE